MKKVIYQEKIINFLINSFKQNRLGHAYIFLGPEGVGKAFTAKYLSQFLNCQDRNSAPCLECSSCIKIENNNHPDVHWIRPEEGSQGIRIEAIRELQEKISLKPYEGNFKIFILEKADFLLEEAGNCLLKTLEDPPGQTILILLAEEKERFLSTIISRCQIVRFPLFKREIIEKFIRENYRIDKTKIPLYIKLAEGSLGKVINLVEEEFLKKRNSVLEKFLERKCFNNELWGKESLQEALFFVGAIFRDALFEKLGVGNLMINIDCIDLIKKIGLSYSKEELYNLIERINLYYNFLQYNVNPRLILTNLEIDLS